MFDGNFNLLDQENIDIAIGEMVIKFYMVNIFKCRSNYYEPKPSYIFL